MEVKSILVISVIIKLQREVVFRNIFSLNMKVSSILVISVIIKLQREVILRNIYSVSTNSTDHRITFWFLLYYYKIIALKLIIVVFSLFYETILKFLQTFIVYTFEMPPRSDKHGPPCQINEPSSFLRLRWRFYPGVLLSQH